MGDRGKQDKTKTLQLAEGFYLSRFSYQLKKTTIHAIISHIIPKNKKYYTQCA
jgi:hypothetical protein